MEVKINVESSDLSFNRNQYKETQHKPWLLFPIYARDLQSLSAATKNCHFEGKGKCKNATKVWDIQENTETGNRFKTGAFEWDAEKPRMQERKEWNNGQRRIWSEELVKF